MRIAAASCFPAHSHFLLQGSGRDACRENLEAAVFGILQIHVHSFGHIVTISHPSPLVHHTGLIALIESDPYDLSPSQVPILRALVKHAHKPPPISKIVGDALTTFWRNHREHWHTEVFALRCRLCLQPLIFAVFFQRHLISDSDFESELLEECRGKRSYYI